MAPKKNWIAKAIKPENEGKFTQKAKKAGMDVQAYADKVTKPNSKASDTTQKEANLAKTLKKINKK